MPCTKHTSQQLSNRHFAFCVLVLCPCSLVFSREEGIFQPLTTHKTAPSTPVQQHWVPAHEPSAPGTHSWWGTEGHHHPTTAPFYEDPQQSFCLAADCSFCCRDRIALEKHLALPNGGLFLLPRMLLLIISM